MEVTLDIGLNQIIRIIKQLPYEQRIQLMKEVERETANQKTDNQKTVDFTELLLNGPVMTEEEEDNFKRINEEFDKWTRSLFA